MARRTVTVTDLLGRDHRQHNWWLEQIPSPEPGPLDRLIAAEAAGGDASDRASVLLWGSAAWPLPGQSRAPAGPEGEALGERPEGRPLPYVGPCVACGGVVRRGHFCLSCDMPKGSLVSRVQATVRRLRRKADRLAGGTGRAG